MFAALAIICALLVIVGCLTIFCWSLNARVNALELDRDWDDDARLTVKRPTLHLLDGDGA